MVRTSPDWLILHLANTAGFRPLLDRPESMSTFDDLLNWTAEQKVLSPAQRRSLMSVDDEERDRIYRRVISFRDAAQSLLSRVVRNRPPSKEDVLLVSDEIRAAFSDRELDIQKGKVVWQHGSSGPESRLLGLLASSAAELLDSEDLGRLRECSGRDCSRLFIDRSRNGTRRWCSMEGCGNRAKARRHYRRTREG